MEFKGLRRLPNPEDIGKYDKEKIKFDLHPKYKPISDVFLAVDAKTGKPLSENERYMPNYFPHGRHLYFTLILELGDRGLLVGKAFTYYQQIVHQLEREMIKEFKYGDIFHNPDDTVGIMVIKQEGNEVQYYKLGPMEGRRFWQCPSLESKGRKMPVSKFASNVLRLNYDRYSKLIPIELTVPK